jgi:uncharacterized protein DUF6119
VSAQLLQEEEDFRIEAARIAEEVSGSRWTFFLVPEIAPFAFEVVYGIIADWRGRSLSEALPLFSKINLRSFAQQLKGRYFKVGCCQVDGLVEVLLELLVGHALVWVGIPHFVPAIFLHPPLARIVAGGASVDGIATVRVVVSAFAALEAGGTLVSVGHTSGSAEVFEYGAMFAGGARGGASGRSIVTFYLLADSDFSTELAWLAERVAVGTLVPQISWRGDWHRLGEAAATLLGRRLHGKAVLDVPCPTRWP